MAKKHTPFCIHEEDWGKIKQKITSETERMDRIEKKVDIILTKLEEMPERYVPRKEFDEFKSNSIIKDRTYSQKVWDVAKLFLAPTITAIVIYFLAKTFGI